MGRSLSIKQVVPDYYAVLNVHRTATRQEIRQQYLACAWEFHPDRGGSHTKMAPINEAWAALKDPKKRKEYDKMLALGDVTCPRCKGMKRVKRARGFKVSEVECDLCCGKGTVS